MEGRRNRQGSSRGKDEEGKWKEMKKGYEGRRKKTEMEKKRE